MIRPFSTILTQNFFILVSLIILSACSLHDSENQSSQSSMNQKDSLGTCEDTTYLINRYGIMVVASTLEPIGAHAFTNWILSPSSQQLILSFGVEEFGQSLFFPDA